MKTLLPLLLSVFVLVPERLLALYSITEMDADSLRKDPSIKIRAQKSGDQITFTLAFRRRADSPEVYWQGALDLVDPNGLLVGRAELRGEAIRRVLGEDALRCWGWEDFGPAEVFRFTVASSMLKKSKFSQETGPRNDDRGIPYGGGIIRWSFLETLVDASGNADGTTAGPGPRGSARDTNRKISVAEVGGVRLEVEQSSLSNDIQVRVDDVGAKACAVTTVVCDLFYVDDAGREHKLEGVTLTNHQASEYAGTFPTEHRFTHGTTARVVYNSPGLRLPVSTWLTLYFH